jgi:antitoxin ParD1/3/4
MSAKRHRHIALTEPHDRFVERQVTEGHYASASEVVRAGLRLPIEREAARAPVVGKDRAAYG